MPSKVSRTIQGVAANWMAFAVSAAVAFFLSPFVVHHLGNATYGVWILVTSTTAYLGLLDLGLRGAVIRFISSHHARAEYEECCHALSVAFWFRVASSVLILAVSLLLAFEIGAWFRIDPNMLSAARIAVGLTGLTFAVTLTGGIFGAALAALQRFDLISAVGIGQVLLNAGGTVWLLRHGYSIVALAILQFTLALVANIIMRALSLRVFPSLRIRLGKPDPAMLRKMTSYSIYMFILSVTGQVIYYTDNVVVGAFRSAEAVALYAIGGRLLEYLRQPTAALAQTFMPLASSLEALSEKESLRQLLILGTRITLLVFWPLGLMLLIRGPRFIGLWMGPEYAETSGTVLRILLIGTMFQSANHGSSNIIFGMGKHRRLAFWQIGEAVANLGLSIFLIRRIGIYGVAWGTTIPELIMDIVLFPPYITSLMEITLWRFFKEAWLRPFVAMLPFAAACIYAERYWIPRTTLAFFLQAAALYPVFLITAAVCFWPETRRLARMIGNKALASRQRGALAPAVVGE